MPPEAPRAPALRSERERPGGHSPAAYTRPTGPFCRARIPMRAALRHPPWQTSRHRRAGRATGGQVGTTAGGYVRLRRNMPALQSRQTRVRGVRGDPSAQDKLIAGRPPGGDWPGRHPAIGGQAASLAYTLRFNGNGRRGYARPIRRRRTCGKAAGFGDPALHTAAI